MNSANLNPVSPPAPIPEHPSLQSPGAGADPFLSILDAAATRAANHHAEAAQTDTAAREDDAPLDEDEPVEEPQESAASATVAPVVVPIDQRGSHATVAAAQSAAAVNPAGKQNTAPTGDRSASSPAAAKNTADGTRVSPAQAVAASASHAERQPPAAGTGDIDLQVTRQDVTSKPTTMLSDTATAKPAPELAPDLRAERYAELRANPANRLTNGPGGGEIRLADIGAPPADGINTKAATSAASQQSSAQHADLGRLAAATPAETPAAQLLAAAANAGPVANGNVPAAAGATAPGSPVLGSALTGAPAVDAAVPAGAVTRDGSLPDAARAAAARNQPATTARTVEQIAVQIKNGLNAGADKIHVRLQPAALGRVDIQLEVGHDQRVQAVVVVEKADTLEILERDARHLHRMLADAGFNTDDSSLTFRQQPSPDEQQANGQGDGSPALTGADEPNENATEPEVQPARHDGLLDVQV